MKVLGGSDQAGRSTFTQQCNHLFVTMWPTKSIVRVTVWQTGVPSHRGNERFTTLPSVYPLADDDATDRVVHRWVMMWLTRYN